MDKHPYPYPTSPPPPSGFVSPPCVPPPCISPPPYIPEGMHPPHSVIIVPTVFSSETQYVTCPHCRASISTRVESEANTKTHLFALLLCFTGFCCCIPCLYCTDSCLVKKHYCPACSAYLGSSEN